MNDLQKAGRGLSGSDKARLLLRSSQTTSVLCKNPKPCPYGSKCIFAHNLEESRLFREAHGGSSRPQQGSGDYAPPGLHRWRSDEVSWRSSSDEPRPYAQPPTCHPAKYKTMLCTYYEQRGFCRHGGSCTFAHGNEELREEPPFASPRGHYAHNRSFSSPSERSYSGGPCSSGESVQSFGGSIPEPPPFDEEVMAAAAAASVPLGEACAAQQQHERERERQVVEAAAAAAPAPAPAAPAAPAGGWAARAAAGGEASKPQAAPAPAPRLASDDDFPALPGSPAAAPNSRAASEAGTSVQSKDGSRFEWDGASSSDGAAKPATVCFNEVPLRSDGSGSSQALSVRSAAASSKAASTAGAERAPTPDPPAASSSPRWADMEDEAEEVAVAEEAAVAEAAGETAVGQEEQQEEEAEQQQHAESGAEANENAEWEPAPAPVVMPPPGFAPAASAPAAVVSAAPAPAAAAPAAAANPARALLLQRLSGAGGFDFYLIPAFICPLTKRPYSDPVVAADGLTYEREAITDWLYRQNKDVSPVNGQALPHRLVLPNDALRRAMADVAQLVHAVVAA